MSIFRLQATTRYKTDRKIQANMKIKSSEYHIRYTKMWLNISKTSEVQWQTEVKISKLSKIILK